MTIRNYAQPVFVNPSARIAGACIVGTGDGHTLATADTREEAEQAKRAYEQVLAPRFTRDEAIAIVRKHIASPAGVIQDGAFAAGVRAALEALAAAGMFSDCGGEGCGQAPELCIAVMRDKLDAAGIR